MYRGISMQNSTRKPKMPQEEAAAGVDIYPVSPPKIVAECFTIACIGDIFRVGNLASLRKTKAIDSKGTDLLADRMHAVATYITEEHIRGQTSLMNPLVDRGRFWTVDPRRSARMSLISYFLTRKHLQHAVPIIADRREPR